MYFSVETWRLFRLTHLLGVNDRMFLNFINELLHYDPSKRLTPREALVHPFLESLLPIRFLYEKGYGGLSHHHLSSMDTLDASIQTEVISMESIPRSTPIYSVKDSIQEQHIHSIDFDNTNLVKNLKEIHSITLTTYPPPPLDIKKSNNDMTIHEISDIPTMNLESDNSSILSTIWSQAKLVSPKLHSSEWISYESMDDSISSYGDGPNILPSPRKLLDETLGSLVDDIWKSFEYENNTNLMSDFQTHNSDDQVTSN